MAKEQIVWKKKPEAEDYDGTLNFLSLIFPAAKSENLLRALRKATKTERAAKDLLRASTLPLLARDEPHVDDDLKRIHKGKPLPPVLLVRGDMTKSVPLIVADGYHRICAIYYYDESAPIPCHRKGRREDRRGDRHGSPDLRTRRSGPALRTVDKKDLAGRRSPVSQACGRNDPLFRNVWYGRGALGTAQANPFRSFGGARLQASCLSARYPDTRSGAACLCLRLMRCRLADDIRSRSSRLRTSARRRATDLRRSYRRSYQGDREYFPRSIPM